MWARQSTEGTACSCGATYPSARRGQAHRDSPVLALLQEGRMHRPPSCQSRDPKTPGLAHQSTWYQDASKNCQLIGQDGTFDSDYVSQAKEAVDPASLFIPKGASVLTALRCSLREPPSHWRVWIPPQVLRRWFLSHTYLEIIPTLEGSAWAHPHSSHSL